MTTDSDEAFSSLNRVLYNTAFVISDTKWEFRVWFLQRKDGLMWTWRKWPPDAEYKVTIHQKCQSLFILFISHKLSKRDEIWYVFWFFFWALKYSPFNYISSLSFLRKWMRWSNKNEDIPYKDHLIMPVFSFVYRQEDPSTIGRIYTCMKCLGPCIPYEERVVRVQIKQL